MNVYDFDKTIVDDDSTKLFLLYCLNKMPRKLLQGISGKLSALYSFASGNETVERFKEECFSFLSYVENPEVLVEQFWDSNMKHIEPWYLKQLRDDDLVISASPEFLVRPACERLGISVIATKMSPFSGKILGANCKGEEKVRRFNAVCPGAHVEEFYSDSLSDTPMAKLAERAFLIKNRTPVPWPEG